jgi:hypothetical protein
MASNVINGEDYLAIATLYSNARVSILGTVDYLYDAVYTVVLSNQTLPTIDLVKELYESYQINADIYRSPSTFLGAVRTINNHVLNRSTSNISDINDYLIDENIQVPMGWAELCKNTGTLICLGRISNPPVNNRFADGTSIPSC